MNPILAKYGYELGVMLILELARRRAVEQNDNSGKEDVIIAAFNGLLLGNTKPLQPDTARGVVDYLADVIQDLLRLGKGE